MLRVSPLAKEWGSRVCRSVVSLQQKIISGIVKQSKFIRKGKKKHMLRSEHELLQSGESKVHIPGRHTWINAWSKFPRIFLCQVNPDPSPPMLLLEQLSRGAFKNNWWFSFNISCKAFVPDVEHLHKGSCHLPSLGLKFCIPTMNHLCHSSVHLWLFLLSRQYYSQY